MKTKTLLLLGVACVAATMVACKGEAPKTEPVAPKTTADSVVLKDYGANPTVLNIEDYTLANENYRTAIWTGENLQVTLMCIPVGGDVGLEIHPNIDQFLRIEQGQGRAMMGPAKDTLNYVRDVADGSAIIVPHNTWHNIVNTGDKPLKLYSIYTPADHPFGTVEKTRAEAMANEAAE